MYCAKCGAEITEGAKYCEKCGNPVGQPEDGKQEDGKQGADEVKKRDVTSKMKQSAAALNEVSDKGKDAAEQIQQKWQASDDKGKKKMLAVAAGIVVAVIVVFAIISTMFKSATAADLNDFVIVKYDGYDGYGTASYLFDNNAFVAKTKGKYKIDVTYYTHGEFDKSEGLSNGDQITFSWKVQEDSLKKAGLHIKYEDKTYTVEGLKEIEESNPFGAIELDYLGMSPKVTASVVSKDSNSVFTAEDFSVEPANDLSEGDTVKVSLNLTEEECIEKYGIKPTKIEQEFTVSGVAGYAKTLDEIPADVMGKLKSEGKDAFEATSAEWGKSSLVSCDYAGAYLFAAKSSDEKLQNELMLVYKVKTALKDELKSGNYIYSLSWEDDMKEVDYYVTVSFPNITKSKDGKYEPESQTPEICGDTFALEMTRSGAWLGNDTQKWNIDFVGYRTLEDLEATAVRSHLDKYTYMTDME